MFNGSEQELCLLDLGVLCSCGQEPRVLRLPRKWFWKVVTSAREGKGRAGLMNWAFALKSHLS